MDPKDIGKLFSSEQLAKIGESFKQSSIQMPKIDYGINTAAFDSIHKANSERLQRELEDNENLKRIAAATEDINAKFDYVSKDLDYILSSLGANFQRLEQLGRSEKETLDQILLALQYKNNEDSKSKIKSLLADKGTDFILNVIIALIQLKMTGM